jgi:glutathione-regulated potassium-efflux system ancillary protein KefG
MARVLILFAHPALEKSRIHRRLIREIPDLPNLTFHDLYEEYPAFDIDVPREQELLLSHDLIVLQHPFFWYSTPPLIKQWEDLVLEHGWAYGSQGVALRGKRMLSLITAGGGASAYQHSGYNRFTIRELLAPIEQTAYLCKMEYYRQTLTLLHDDGIDLAAIAGYDTLNAALEPIFAGEVLA